MIDVNPRVALTEPTLFPPPPCVLHLFVTVSPPTGSTIGKPFPSQKVHSHGPQKCVKTLAPGGLFKSISIFSVLVCHAN